MDDEETAYWWLRLLATLHGIELGQAHKALAHIADHSHCLPLILAQLHRWPGPS